MCGRHRLSARGAIDPDGEIGEFGPEFHGPQQIAIQAGPVDPGLRAGFFRGGLGGDRSRNVDREIRREARDFGCEHRRLFRRAQKVRLPGVFRPPVLGPARLIGALGHQHRFPRGRSGRFRFQPTEFGRRRIASCLQTRPFHFRIDQTGSQRDELAEDRQVRAEIAVRLKLPADAWGIGRTCGGAVDLHLQFDPFRFRFFPKLRLVQPRVCDFAGRIGCGFRALRPPRGLDRRCHFQGRHLDRDGALVLEPFQFPFLGPGILRDPRGQALEALEPENAF